MQTGELNVEIFQEVGCRLLMLPQGVGVIVHNLDSATDGDDILMTLTPDKSIRIHNPVVQDLEISPILLDHLINTSAVLYFYNYKEQTAEVCPFMGMVELSRDELLELRGGLKWS